MDWKSWARSPRMFLIGLVVGCLAGIGIGSAVRREHTEFVLRVEPLVTPSAVVVYVTGAVRRPGLYTVSSGSRVAQVIAQAQPREDADVDRLGMAAPVRDGETIVVPSRNTATSSPGPTEHERPQAGTPASPTIDINQATATELEQVPGIGPALAQRIVEYRNTHGPFRSLDELVAIQGISQRMVDSWRDVLTVGTSP